MSLCQWFGCVLCLLSLLLGTCANQAAAQMIHSTTDIYDFKSGIRIRGVPHEAPYLEGGAASAAGQVCISDQAGLCTWQTIPPDCILSFDVTTNLFSCAQGAGVSVGAASVLQASNGASGFAAYGGSNVCNGALGQAVVGLSATGAAVCQDIAPPTSGIHAVTTRAEASLTGETNLGALASGVLTQAVTAGEASLQTVPQPAGQLVGTTASQRLTNKGIDARACPSANDDSTIAVDLDACDIITVANLLQPSTVLNPTGSATVGQWMRFQLCSATSQALTWENQWTAGAGIPLPSVTQGAGKCDLLLFQYDSSTSHMVLIHDVKLFSSICPGGVLTPGSYTNVSLTVDASGCLSVVSTGTGGAGTATAAGADGDVQFKTGTLLDADTGVYAYDAGSDTLVVPNIQNSTGGTTYTFIDAAGHTGYLFAPPVMSNDWGWDLPDEPGKLCVLGGTCFTGYSTASSTDTLTNKTLDVEATGNAITTVSKIWLPAAGCQGTTAGLLWDTPVSNPAVAACVTGTNTQKGVADFADGSNLSMQITTLLPGDWVGAIDAKLPWFTSATTGSVVWQLATICVADGETDDPAFNTASTVTDAAKGTTLQVNNATITGVITTGCAAGELMHVKVSRDSAHASDDLAATARLLGLELTFRRTQ